MAAEDQAREPVAVLYLRFALPSLFVFLKCSLVFVLAGILIRSLSFCVCCEDLSVLKFLEVVQINYMIHAVVRIFFREGE